MRISGRVKRRSHHRLRRTAHIGDSVRYMTVLPMHREIKNARQHTAKLGF